MKETDAARDPQRGRLVKRERLLAELRAGDESAYADLFHERFARLRDYAFSYVKSWDDAADIVQQVFINLYASRGQLSVSQTLQAYLYGAVHHRALNHLRRARVRQRWLEREAQASDVVGDDRAWSAADAEVLRGEQWEQARQLIDELPPRCKDAFLLVRAEGLRYDEAAAALGVARSTVQTHLVRAAKILGRLAAARGLIDAPSQGAHVAGSEGGGRTDAG